MNTPTIYLDHAATTAIHPEVLEAMMSFLTGTYGNPSSAHRAGREARAAVERARKDVAALLHVKPSEILFTSGGTESNNTAFAVAVRNLCCRHLISSPVEHHSVLYPFENYSLQTGMNSSMVALTKEGAVNYRDLQKQLYYFTKVNRKCFVSLMHGNNETGALLDTGAVAEICREFGAVFHTDGVQTVGYYPLNVKETGAHFLSASGHKFGGPKGVGILYVDESISMEPLIFGGGQERGRRAGTENVAGIVGLAKALQIAMRDFEKKAAHIKSLKERLAQQLLDSVENLSFNGNPEEGLPTVLSVNFPKAVFSSSLLLDLDRNGICASGGAANSLGIGSHVMRELDRLDDFITVRFSFSETNTEEEIDRVAEVVRELMMEEAVC
jgi:cysteine desulfurase